MSQVVLITGGLGYLGGRLSRYLAASGRSVRVGTRRPSEEWPEWSHGLEVVQADLLADMDLSDVCNGVDVVVHLAGPNAQVCAADPGRAGSENLMVTERLLRAAERANVSRFIYFSTAHVYGSPLKGLITEAVLPRPAHPYAIANRIAEDFVLATHDRGAMAGLVFRLSNGVGAPADIGADCWSLVTNDLCRQAVRARKLTLRTSGLQVRDFVPLDDIVRAVVHALAMTPEDWGDGLFNLGGHETLSIFEMSQRVAQRCQAVLGYEPPIERPSADPSEHVGTLHYRSDKLKATGFTWKGSIDGEIDATLRFCLDARGGAGGS